ncbi:hypothetical protein EON63_24200, partial [archaeon]
MYVYVYVYVRECLWLCVCICKQIYVRICAYEHTHYLPTINLPKHITHIFGARNITNPPNRKMYIHTTMAPLIVHHLNN